VTLPALDALQTLKKIAKKTLSDGVFDQISDQIVSGRMEPGDQLPSERELCEALGVNRGAVREALQRLSQAGLVSISQGGGTKVLDFRRFAGLDVLDRLLLSEDGSVDLPVARSIMEMRAALAPDIARLCALRADEACAGALQQVVAKMDVAGEDLEQLQLLSLEFWDVLVRGSDNIAYELAFNGLRSTYDKIRGALVQVMADELRDVAGHRAIAQAVGRGDELSAKHNAAGLVERGTRRVFEFIAALEGPRPTRGTKGGAA
jgi:DNA-binding FadR family transcriptional regulator